MKPLDGLTFISLSPSALSLPTLLTGSNIRSSCQPPARARHICSQTLPAARAGQTHCRLALEIQPQQATTVPHYPHWITMISTNTFHSTLHTHSRGHELRFRDRTARVGIKTGFSLGRNLKLLRASSALSNGADNSTFPTAFRGPLSETVPGTRAGSIHSACGCYCCYCCLRLTPAL